MPHNHCLLPISFPPQTYIAPWLAVPTCHPTCDSFGWTIASGTGVIGRRCRSLSDFGTCIIAGADPATTATSPWLTNRCVVSTTIVGCPVGFFDVSGEVTGMPPSDPNFRVCAAWTPCNTTTQYEAVAPTSSTERTCGTIAAPCVFPQQYELAAPTATSNRLCNTTTAVCPSSTYQTSLPTPTSDRGCNALTRSGTSLTHHVSTLSCHVPTFAMACVSRVFHYPCTIACSSHTIACFNADNDAEHLVPPIMCFMHAAYSLLRRDYCLPQVFHGAYSSVGSADCHVGPCLSKRDGVQQHDRVRNFGGDHTDRPCVCTVESVPVAIVVS